MLASRAVLLANVTEISTRLAFGRVAGHMVATYCPMLRLATFIATSEIAFFAHFSQLMNIFLLLFVCSQTYLILFTSLPCVDSGALGTELELTDPALIVERICVNRVIS
jgi:hypothetical protein